MKTTEFSNQVRSFLPEIIELLVTGLIIALSDILFQTDANTNVLLGVIGLSTIALTLAIRQQVKSQTAEISDQLELYRLLNDIEWPDLREQGMEAVKECKRKLSQLADGIDISMSGSMKEEEDWTNAAKRIGRAQKVIRVTGARLWAIADPDKTSLLGPDHLRQALVDAVQRNVLVEKLYIGRRTDLKKASPEQIKAYVDYCRVDEENGVQAHILWMDNLDPKTVTQPSFLICDDREVQFFVVLQRRMEEYRGVTVTRNPQVVRGYLERFEDWKHLGNPFAEVPEFQNVLDVEVPDDDKPTG